MLLSLVSDNILRSVKKLPQAVMAVAAAAAVVIRRSAIYQGLLCLF